MSELSSANPEGLPPTAAPPLDLIYQRFEDAWRAGQHPRAEDFLGDTPEPQRSELLRGLLEREMRYRAGAGAGPAPREHRVPFLEPSEPCVTSQPEFVLAPPTTTPWTALPGYEILGELGRGGMGVVLKGRDPELSRDLAVKLLLSTHQDNPAVVQRFIEEAQIGGQLQHPGIVPVYELGRSPDQRPYFTMKLVHGRTLAALLQARTDSAQDRPRFLTIFEQVCQTLAYAHAQGVIHRDLKPSNIMVGAFGEVQVMDWGLAKVLPQGGTDQERVSRGLASAGEAAGAIRTVRTEGTAAESQVGTVLGTPAYMAPEQARGEVQRLDQRCDVFGLGAILCQVLTGEAPYSGATTWQIYQKALAGDLTDALARLETSGAEAELVRITRACLASEPGNRPRDAGEVARDVTAYLASVAERLRAAELAAARAAARAEQERKARRLTVALAASVLALVLLGGGGWLWREHDRGTRAEATASKVNQALAEADQLWGQARSAPAGELRRWTEVLAAARHARGLLATGEADKALQRRVRELSAGVAKEARQAQRLAEEIDQDRHMVARLEEVRLLKAEVRDGSFDDSRAGPAYAAAFRKYGIDVEKLDPDEAAARVGRRAIRAPLAAALDDWAFLGKDNGRLRRLLCIARAADPDRQRNRLRDALLRRDRRTLERWAHPDRVAALPPPTVKLLATALARMGAWEEALAVLRRGQREHPDDFWINHTLGFYLVHRDVPPLARYRVPLGGLLAAAPWGPLPLLTALQLRPRDPVIPWDEALRFYSVAAALRPRNAGVHVNLGIALFSTGRTAEAVAAFRKAITLKPDYVQAHNNLGIALRRAGQLERASAVLRRAILLKPTYDVTHYNLGLVLDQQGNLDGAIAAYRVAIRLKPKLAEYHHNLGVVLGRKGLREQRLLDQAVAAYRAAIRLRPGDPTTHANLGGILAYQGKLEDAAATYRQALRLDPDDARSWYRLGVILCRQGRLDEGIVAFRQSVRLNPDFAAGHSMLGVLLGNKGEVDQAIAAFRQVLRLKDDAATYCHLGALLCNHKRDYDGAIAALRQALRLKPNHASAHYNLGRTLLMQGQFAAGLAALRRGHELGSRQPTWRLPSADWVRLGERLVELDEKLPKVLKGEARPADNNERVGLARLCQRYKRLYGTAARLWQEAFTAQPKLTEDLKAGYRYEAACAAALAAVGSGLDGAGLKGPARVRWRKQALDWLRADLTLWARQLENKTAPAAALVHKTLHQWQRDSDLAGLRDPEALAKLPAEERQTCRQLWSEVEALLRRTRGPVAKK